MLETCDQSDGDTWPTKKNQQRQRRDPFHPPPESANPKHEDPKWLWKLSPWYLWHHSPVLLTLTNAPRIQRLTLCSVVFRHYCSSDCAWLTSHSCWLECCFVFLWYLCLYWELPDPSLAPRVSDWPVERMTWNMELLQPPGDISLHSDNKHYHAGLVMFGISHVTLWGDFD